MSQTIGTITPCPITGIAKSTESKRPKKAKVRLKFISFSLKSDFRKFGEFVWLFREREARETLAVFLKTAEKSFFRSDLLVRGLVFK
jgi:hypothetical protein